MQIEGLKEYSHRNRKSRFEGLSKELRLAAFDWLMRLVMKGTRERGNVPQWLYAIYVGQARRLAVHPPTSAWGRSMLAKRGGLAVQRRYRQEKEQPTAKATLARLAEQEIRGSAPEPIAPEPPRISPAGFGEDGCFAALTVIRGCVFPGHN